MKSGAPLTSSPREGTFDSSLALFAEVYTFIGERCRRPGRNRPFEEVLRLVSHAVPGTVTVMTTWSMIGTRGIRVSGGLAHSSRRGA